MLQLAGLHAVDGVLIAPVPSGFDDQEFAAFKRGVLAALHGSSLRGAVIDASRVLTREPDNYAARADVMWAGSLSHNGLTGCGTGGGDWVCHKLEHELGGLFDVAHGAGLAAVWGSWARYVLPANPARFARFAQRVLGTAPGGDDTDTALRGVEAMEAYYRSIGMPTSLRELGVEPTQAQIGEMAEKFAVAARGGMGAIQTIREADAAAIYQAAR